VRRHERGGGACARFRFGKRKARWLGSGGRRLMV
jgi:hypothetical protein